MQKSFSVRLSLSTAFLVLSFCASSAQDAVSRAFTRGSGQTAVGINEGGEDTELEGPQAIYSGDKGEIYLLDQINNRILKYDPGAPGAPPQALELPDGVAATDIVVTNGEIHVWDGRVITLEATGRPDALTRGLSVTRSSEPPDEATTEAFSQMGSTNPTDDIESAVEPTRSIAPAGRSRQSVASRGRGAVVANFSPLGGDSGVQINIAPKGGGNPLAKLDLKVRGRLGAVDLLEVDKLGRSFVFAENVPEEAGDAPSTFVARFGANSALEGIYELPLTPNSGLTRRFVTVSPEGEVFFLRNRKGASEVLGVGFRRMAKGQTIGIGESISFADLPHLKGANAAVRPMTRLQVIQTGAAFANVHWRVTPSAYGGDPDSRCSGFNRVRRPGYLNGKMNQEVIGIPYCWGCHGSLPTVANLIGRGMLAGNVCTRNDPRRDVAGVDCSAFVSAAWGLSTHFTTIAIPAITRELASGWDLLPGDALNKPGSHVMLFVRFTPDKKAEVLESSPGACNGKVCRSVYPLGSLLARGYRPVRYKALLNDTPVLANGAQQPAPVRR